MLRKAFVSLSAEDYQESCQLTQKALVANVIMLLLKPGFLPLGVTRLYTHSRNQTFVFIFHESRRTFMLGANSIVRTFTFAAPSQRVSPRGPKPVKPNPVSMAAPLMTING